MTAIFDRVPHPLGVHGLAQAHWLTMHASRIAASVLLCTLAGYALRGADLVQGVQAMSVAKWPFMVMGVVAVASWLIGRKLHVLSWEAIPAPRRGHHAPADLVRSAPWRAVDWAARCIHACIVCLAGVAIVNQPGSLPAAAVGLVGATTVAFTLVTVAVRVVHALLTVASHADSSVWYTLIGLAAIDLAAALVVTALGSPDLRSVGLTVGAMAATLIAFIRYAWSNATA